jgi:hypothetical protein
MWRGSKKWAIYVSTVSTYWEEKIMVLREFLKKSKKNIRFT